MSNQKRRMFAVELQPLAGSRFQPTGFPDLGAARFKRPDGTGDWQDCLLVESEQSMANRLEATGWDSGACAPVPSFEWLPYVRVVAPSGEFLTSSRLEAHRLASPFVHESTIGGRSGLEVIKEALGLGGDVPLHRPTLAAALLKLDPLCLVHGVFFARKEYTGQPKFMRAVSSFIEAVDVLAAESGGVKKDSVKHSVEEGRGTSEGYGMVPFQRQEFVAQQITAFFKVDLELLRSYGLPAEGTALLETLACWEIRHLLDGGLRLRTSCDLELLSSEIVDHNGNKLPSADELDDALRAAIKAASGLLGGGAVIEAVHDTKKPKGKNSGDSEQAG